MSSYSARILDKPCQNLRFVIDQNVNYTTKCTVDAEGKSTHFWRPPGYYTLVCFKDHESQVNTTVLQSLAFADYLSSRQSAYFADLNQILSSSHKVTAI